MARRNRKQEQEQEQVAQEHDTATQPEPEAPPPDAAVAIRAPAGAVMNPADLIAGLTKYQQDAPPLASGDVFLRLLKEGAWVYGPESVDVEIESLWAANPYSIQHGYACWGDGELLGEQMVAFNEVVADAMTLPNLGPKWDVQVSIRMTCTNGEDTGQDVLFKTTSLGGKRAHGDLVDAIAKHVAEDPSTPVPILKLEMAHYQHKKYGRIYTPSFEVISWASFEGAPGEPAAVAAEPEPTTRRRRRRAA